MIEPAQYLPEPSGFSPDPFWTSFWIATGLILVIVALVGAIISLVNRIEGQAARTSVRLMQGKEASAAFEDLVEASADLRATARAVRGRS